MRQTRYWTVLLYEEPVLEGHGLLGAKVTTAEEGVQLIERGKAVSATTDVCLEILAHLELKWSRSLE